MTKSFTLIIIFVLSAIGVHAQLDFCGTDAFRKALENHNPGYKQDEAHQNKQLCNYVTTHPATADKGNLIVYTIPMVFHVVHLNGPENVPDSNITNAVNELNLRFQNAAPYTDSSGHTVNLQFCLATVDPWGNPTNGITRDTSFRTDLAWSFDSTGLVLNFDDVVSLKNVNRWCPATYLNVWVVRSSPTFSSYPAPNSYAYDGIVGVYPFLTGGYVLTHEVGHYFNLYHTFEGSCTNFNCLLDGDYVCDTPPQNKGAFVCGASSCGTDMSDTSGFNPFTADQNDLPNYMGAAPCPFSFSQGQADRMEIALTLLRPSLLQSNGCGANPGGVLPVASFTIDSSFALCTGTYGFQSTSANSLYTAWDFDNDGRTDAVGDYVTHTFTATGYYSVNLIVSSYGGSDSVIQTIYVYVNPYPTYPVLTFYPGLTIDPILQTPAACIGTTVSLYGALGMSSYLWSTGETTQSITFITDSTRLIYLTVTDSTGRIIENCTALKVTVNTPLHLTIITGADTVNCQELVTIRLLPNPYWWPASNTWYNNGAWLSANQFVLGNYGYTSGLHNIWTTNNVDPIGCITNSDTVSFYVNPPPPVVISQQGAVLTLPFRCLFTTWFKDGVALNVNDSVLTVTANGCYTASCASCGYFPSDTVCITSLGISETNLGNTTIMPNPFTNQTTIAFGEPQINTSILIMDVLGKVVKSITVTGKECILEKGDMKPGVYFVRITNSNFGVINKKVVIQ